MIQRQVVVPAGVEELWHALTDPEQAGDWMGGDLSWEIEEGAPLRFTPGESDGPAREGRVEEVEPGRYLRFSWWPAEGDRQPSEVVYVLEPEPDGSTILTVEEVVLAWTQSDTAQFRNYAHNSVMSSAASA